MNNTSFEYIRDHFLNPRNQGEIPDPDLVLEMGSIAEGNALKLMLKLDSSERICQVRFQSFGACDAIAAISMLTEMLHGKTLAEAAAITEKDIWDGSQGSGHLPMFNPRRVITLMRQAGQYLNTEKMNGRAPNTLTSE